MQGILERLQKEDKLDKEIGERKVLKEEVQWLKGEVVMLLERVERIEERLKVGKETCGRDGDKI